MSLDNVHINLAKHALLTYLKSEQGGKGFSLENNSTPNEVKESYKNLQVFEAGNKGIDYCHLFLNEASKKVVVAFRGTTSEEGKSLQDWGNNMKQNLVAFSELDKAIMIHEGYNTSINNLLNKKNRDNKKIRDIISEWKNSGVATSIHITGHSKGGALAGLFAARISDIFNKDEITVVTFAAPKLGNEQFKVYYNNLVSKHYRYENVYDLVPQLPLVNVGIGRARAIAIKTLIPVAKVLFQDTDDRYVHIGQRSVVSFDESVKTLFTNISEDKYYKAAVAASILNSVRQVKFKFKQFPTACIAEHSMEKYIHALEHKR